MANVISGTGTLTKAGTGTHDPHRRPTPTAATRRSAPARCSRQRRHDRQLGTGAVVNNGALTFNRSDALTVANGSAAPARSPRPAPARTTLTGDQHLHAATTTISAGTLQVGNGGTTGSSGPATSSTTRRSTFNRSDALTLWPA